MRTPVLVCAGALSLVCRAGSAATPDAPYFKPLEHQSVKADQSIATDLSDDGSIVVGYVGLPGVGEQPCRWVVGDMVQVLGMPPGESDWSVLLSVSGDGLVSVGFAFVANERAGIVHEVGEPLAWVSDLVPGRPTLECRAISPDGRFIIGVDPPGPVWRLDRFTGEFLELPAVGGGQFSAAGGVSADGARVAANFTRTDGHISTKFWEQGLGWRETLTSGQSHFSRAVSRDGSTVVGAVFVAPDADLGFVWKSTGSMRTLEDFPEAPTFAAAYDVSADGRVVVGYGWKSDGQVAAVWTRNRGIRSVEELLTGVPAEQLAGWRLLVARAVTPDGRTLCGYGYNPAGDWQGWIARIRPPCFEDLNGDDVVNNTDLGILIGSWRQTSDLADVNLDSFVDARDLASLLGSWGPCP